MTKITSSHFGVSLPKVAALAQLEADIRDRGLEPLAKEKRIEILGNECLDQFLDNQKVYYYMEVMQAILNGSSEQ